MKNSNLLLKAALAVFMLIVTAGLLLAQKNADQKAIKVQTNLDCHACKVKIEKYMAFEKGVTSVEADVSTKIVTIGYRSSRTNEEKLCKAIEKIGYKAEVVKDEKEKASGEKK